MNNNNEISKIILYGTTWCSDCHRSRRFLKDNDVEFIDINIDEDPDAREHVMSLNNGNRSVPTILFPDGSILVEPSNLELAEKLELS